jgi:hypothetical protein
MSLIVSNDLVHLYWGNGVGKKKMMKAVQVEERTVLVLIVIDTSDRQ